MDQKPKNTSHDKSFDALLGISKNTSSLQDDLSFLKSYILTDLESNVDCNHQERLSDLKQIITPMMEMTLNEELPQVIKHIDSLKNAKIAHVHQSITCWNLMVEEDIKFC